MKFLHSKSKQELVTAQAAASMFAYDANTGELTKRSGRYAGQIAGALTKRGYRQVLINGKFFSAHRVCWLIHYGSWPDGDIDHINCARDDNRILNLRSVSAKQNNLNRKDGSLPRYYSFDKSKNKWRVYVLVNNKYKHMKYFSTETEASAAANWLRREA
jgi:hypothetical protein